MKRPTDPRVVILIPAVPLFSMKPAPATRMVGCQNNPHHCHQPVSKMLGKGVPNSLLPNQSVQILSKISCEHLVIFSKRPLCCILSHGAKSQPGISGLQLFLQLFEQHSRECFKLIAPAAEQRGLETPTDTQHAATMCLLDEDQMKISPGWASWAPLSHLQLLTFRPTFLHPLRSELSSSTNSSFQCHKHSRHLP